MTHGLGLEDPLRLLVTYLQQLAAGAKRCILPQFMLNSFQFVLLLLVEKRLDAAQPGF
jgi:hypothetical protein